MRVTYKVRHAPEDEILKRNIQRHVVDKITKLYDDPAARLDVELDDLFGPQKGVDKRCRLRFYMPHLKQPLTVVEEHADFDTAIYRAGRRLVREIQRMWDWKVVRPQYPKKYYVARLANQPEASAAEEGEEAEGTEA